MMEKIEEDDVIKCRCIESLTEFIKKNAFDNKVKIIETMIACGLCIITKNSFGI